MLKAALAEFAMGVCRKAMSKDRTLINANGHYALEIS